MKYNLIIIILSASLIILTIFYFKNYKDLYRQSLELNLDPLQEKSITSEFNHKILAIGSSSIEYWPFEDINLTDNILFNAGIGGQTSIQVLYRFERLILIHKPQYLIVQVGLNDIKSIGVLNNQGKIVGNLYSNLTKIFDLCELNNIIPIYITNFPTGRRGILRSMVWNRTLDSLIYDTNSEIKAICRDRDVYIFDAYELLVEPNSLKRKSEYSSDFLHLNSEGYNLLNKRFDLILRTIIK